MLASMNAYQRNPPAQSQQNHTVPLVTVDVMGIA